MSPTLGFATAASGEIIDTIEADNVSMKVSGKELGADSLWDLVENLGHQIRQGGVNAVNLLSDMAEQLSDKFSVAVRKISAGGYGAKNAEPGKEPFEAKDIFAVDKHPGVGRPKKSTAQANKA